MRQVVADHERVLARGPDREPAVPPLRHGVVRLHRVGVRVGVAILAFEDQVGAGEGGLDVADLLDRGRTDVGVVALDVLVEAAMEALLGLLLVQDRRAWHQRPFNVDHHRERLVVHEDRLGGLTGCQLILGHDADHGLAGVAHDAVGQDGVVRQGVAVIQVDVAAGLEVPGGHHRDHAGHGPGPAGVDRANPGVRVWAAEHARPGHAGDGHVRRVAGGAGDLGDSVAPRDGLADRRRRRRPGGHPLHGLAPASAARSRACSAAWRTASMIGR